MAVETTISEISRAISELEEEKTLQLVKKALQIGIPASKIILEGLSRGMEIIGQKYEAKEYFLAELIMGATIMNNAFKILEPYIHKDVGKEKLSTSGVIVIGTVEGDIHDIGKNIVISLLSATGFEVHDLGIDVPTKKFIEAVKKFKPDILGMSALLATTMLKMKDVIDALVKEGLRNHVYVMIGGAPTSAEFAREIGADAYCKDALEALKVAREYVSRKHGE